MPRLAIGATAPAFTLTDQHGGRRRLADLVASAGGGRVILYFYPAAMTPGCTKQACDFRDSLAALAAGGYTVVGISPDTPAKLAEFAETEGLTFPLLSDPDHVAMEKYGAWGEKSLYGKTVTGVIRSTIVLDGRGKVTHAFYNVKATGHVAKLRRDLGS